MQHSDSPNFPDLLNIPDSQTFFKELGDWLSSSIQAGVSGSISQIATTVVLGVLAIIAFFTVIRILKGIIVSIVKSTSKARAERLATATSNAAFRDTIHVLHSDDIVRKKIGTSQKEALRRMGVTYIDKSELAPRNLKDLLASTRESIGSKPAMSEDFFSHLTTNAKTKQGSESVKKLQKVWDRFNEIVITAETDEDISKATRNFLRNEGKALNTPETYEGIKDALYKSSDRGDLVARLLDVQSASMKKNGLPDLVQESEGLYSNYMKSAVSGSKETDKKGSKATEKNIFSQYL